MSQTEARIALTSGSESDAISVGHLCAAAGELFGEAGSELVRNAARVVEGGTDPELSRAGLVAASLLEPLRLGPAVLAAAVVAPCMESSEDPLLEALDPEVQELTRGVLRLSAITWNSPGKQGAEGLRKLFLALARDVRVVVILLALRVQRLGSVFVEGTAMEDARRLAQDTLDVFAPLANRLGIGQFKWELEDHAFRILEPATFEELGRLLAERRDERQAFIDEVAGVLSQAMERENLPGKVLGRPKHLYSIYRKMLNKQISFDQVYDVSAIRVITGRVQECYAILGLVHAIWHPIPHEFDDYIANPKVNGYQSLHTAVIGPRGRPVEIQIRTMEMHEYAELGIAAHWAYKEKRPHQQLPGDRFMALRQLLDWDQAGTDPAHLAARLKTDLFEDQVLVFTPKGEIVTLPRGSTPVDFAYRIHTMVGHRCRGARVNDQIVSLTTVLETGQRVEILTHKQPQPSRDWMNPALGYLRTSSARAKVRAWFREQSREEAQAAGKELVHREMARLELRKPRLDEVARALRYGSVEELFVQVGYGNRRVQAVGALALQLDRAESAPPPSVPPAAVPRRRAPTGGLSMAGVDDILGKAARCCSPLPGDDVVGFVTRGRGLVIHRRDCTQVQETREPERVVDLDWGPDRSERHTSQIAVVAVDRSGLLAHLLNVMAHFGVSLSSAQRHRNSDGTASLQLDLEFKNARHLSLVLEALERQPDVLSVHRVSQ